MTEKDLETRIIGKLSTALGTLSHGTTGAWQFADQLAPEDCDALLEVAVEPRSYEIETTPTASFAVTIRMTVRRELPTIPPISYIEPLQAKLQAWQTDYAAAALDLDGTDLSIVGFVLNGGTMENNIDQANSVWEQTATVRGIIVESTTNEQE